MSELAKLIDLGSRLKRRYHYEMVLAIAPTASESETKVFLDKLKKALEETNGILLRLDDWGKRRLPHPMEKHSVAHYVYLRLVGGKDSVAALERLCKIDVLALRYLTVSKSSSLSEAEIKNLVENAPKEASSVPSLKGDDDEFAFEASY